MIAAAVGLSLEARRARVLPRGDPHTGRKTRGFRAKPKFFEFRISGIAWKFCDGG